MRKAFEGRFKVLCHLSCICATLRVMGEIIPTESMDFDNILIPTQLVTQEFNCDC